MGDATRRHPTTDLDMKAAIGIEAKYDNVYQEFKLWRNITNIVVPGLGDMTFGYLPPSHWVARITGFDPKWKYAREWVRYKKDYRKSNSKGSRGVYKWYILESGNIYEIKEDSRHRYFCIVNDNGEIEYVEEEYVKEWIKNNSE